MVEVCEGAPVAVSGRVVVFPIVGFLLLFRMHLIRGVFRPVVNMHNTQHDSPPAVEQLRIS